ncbi:winged helix-turn-helix transcriptional regulator [Kribbella kalugense]|uniref:HxlR family transcriptional regulator n=1 Tax=Kribbella kalugense TaxID=2512221 RepID=A0A4R7ZIR7_9ACTN|nr:helix-turn-helix domain-containing protein [Kribbella kalugense]TDW14970.1 HxlR family transcriptional regulator [Kribbella kalugense]
MSTLARLVHFRWAVPVLAELHRGHGGRFVNLTHTLGVSRESLRRTLTFLLETDLIRRNPGKGHPLRPEYLLTDPQLGADAAVLTDLLDNLGVTDVGLKKWSLPTLTLLASERRFSEIRRALPDVTPRALTLTLKDLESSGLINRTVTEHYPPSTVYSTTPPGLRLAHAAQKLGMMSLP